MDKYVQHSDFSKEKEHHGPSYEIPEDFAVSVFAAPVTNTTRQKVVDWQELCRQLQDDTVMLPDNKAETKAKHGQYFVRGVVDGRRDDDHLGECYLLILDVDTPLPGGALPSVEEIHDALGDIFHIVSSSATPGRSRIIVPVEAYRKDATETLTRQLYDFCRSVGLEFAYSGESKTKSQPWFYGQHLANKQHRCLINDDGFLFNPDPDKPLPDADEQADQGDGQRSEANHLAEFIAELKTGTIHEAAKRYAGWLSRTTNLTTNQIFSDITTLIKSFCSDADKVARWHEYERANLEKWFSENVKPGFTGHDDFAEFITGAAAAAEQPILMTAEDCEIDGDDTLDIDPAILDPGGLISLGVKGLSQPGMAPIPQYNLPVVLTVLANSIAGLLKFQNVHPNVYNTKIGPTSDGKSDSDKAMGAAIRNTSLADTFYGPTEFASGPALLRTLADRPRCMLVIDEGTSLFRRNGKADPVADGKRDALLEVYSKSGGVIDKSYADKRNNILINNPCVSLTANATPTVFSAIEHQDFSTGLMQRFDFWRYDGPALKRATLADENPYLDSFAERIAAIRLSLSGIEGYNLAGTTGAAIPLQATPQAETRRQEWSDTIVDRVNAAEDDGMRGIISRSYDLAIKYAMIHLAATRQGKELTEPLTVADIEYGIAVAWMLAEWKITKLRSKVTCGDFDAAREIFKLAIRRAVAANRRPVMSYLNNRCKELRNFPPAFKDQIIKSLVESGEVYVDTTKRELGYFLINGSAL